MAPHKNGTVERRVVLSGALAGIAVSVAGCSSSDDAEQASGQPSDTETVEAPEAPAVGGFGQLVDVDLAIEELPAEIAAGNGFAYRPEARAWLVAYPAEHVEKAKELYPEALHSSLDNGFLALFQKCPHLGCRVPECNLSQKFECPCHGSQYSQTGEHVAGPSPRGMDLFATSVVDGALFIDTETVYEGLPIGTNITGWEPTEPGQSCVGDLGN